MRIGSDRFIARVALFLNKDAASVLRDDCLDARIVMAQPDDEDAGISTGLLVVEGREGDLVSALEICALADDQRASPHAPFPARRSLR